MSDKKQEIFVGTLTAPYDSDKYLTFLRELLSDMKQIAPDKNVPIYNTFSVAVDHYNHIGNYVGQDNNKVAVFSVCLKDYRNIENARSMQRGFVKSLLENSDCAGALVAFHTKDKPEKWRLSLVRMDYEFSKGKLSEKLTPAKRYSYLVGEGEPCHTAQERLYPIFVNDNFNPGLDELEEAFSVEAVTKDFFDQYREKYLDLKDYLEQNPQFMAEAQSRGFDSEQFAKKLLGQIVFLYFIQKKGWLGVNAFPPDLTKRDYNNAFYCRGYGSKPKELLPVTYKPTQDGKFARDGKAIRSLSDENQTLLSKFVKGEKWGDGPRDFMRQLFKACVKSGKNYFDDYLEPLFYDGLNQSRGENAFFPPLHCRIPFLNGGLFEEMEGYDWRNNHFRIPNELFSNADTKGWDADGILDVFDRYNFTMAEDEPMEREVAIDPEMLGKVFENLLDIKDRKSKGAFYTPREIVHYMCQESLINYLSGRTGVPSDDIRKFVLYGEYFRDEDVKKTLFVKGQNGAKGHYEFDRSKPMEIPETIFSYRKNVNRLREIDELLANVKVVDLAVGSGAFPLGMLNEIVRARDTITSYMTIEMNSAQRLMCRSDRDLYRLKRDAIKNSIFACDIEPSAADITKLRLWLSLVIDDVIQEQDDDILGYSTKPRELPNLDCNVICGNSLMDSFRGLPLITESSALNNLSVNSQTSMYDLHVAQRINDLIQYQSQLYDEKDSEGKKDFKRQIQDIYDEIIFAQIGDSGDSADEYRQSSVLASRPFVLWQLYFPKVFRDNGGFDIAIGNPPYVQLQKTINEDTGEKLGDSFSKLGFDTFTKTGDIYCLFYEKGYRLLRDGGVLAFITSNKWMRAGYGEKLRAFFAEKTNPVCLIDFAGQKVFDSATVDVNILIFSKGTNQGHTQACIIRENCLNNLSVYIERNSAPTSFEKSKSWAILSQIEAGIKSKIEAIGIPLKDWNININRGVLTGYNEAFIITGHKRDELIAEDSGAAEIIRPILRGRDIQRYGFNFANLWLINVHNGLKENDLPPIDVNDYPAIKNHLNHYYAKLAKRADKGVTPYNLRNCAYMNDFFKQKIVWGEISDKPKFAIDIDGKFTPEATTFMMTGKHLKYLLCFLNSTLSEYYFAKIGTTTGMGTLRWKKYLIETLPVPKVEPQTASILEGLLDSMLANFDNAEYYIARINKVIYGIFNFNAEEIDFIENMVKIGAH